MKFVGKWVEPEKVILIEVIQTQKVNDVSIQNNTYQFSPCSIKLHCHKHKVGNMLLTYETQLHNDLLSIMPELEFYFLQSTCNFSLSIVERKRKKNSCKSRPEHTQLKKKNYPLFYLHLNSLFENMNLRDKWLGLMTFL